MKRRTITWCGLVLAASVASGSGIARNPAPTRPPLASVSHIAVYARDPARSERFYVHDLGAVKRPDPEHPSGARYYFAPTQFVEVLPLPPGHRSINRLAHVAFNTADADAMRRYLAAQGVRVPARLDRAADGSRWFAVTDPEGTIVQFMQPPATPPAVSLNPLSSHVMHVGFIVHDRAKQDRFYRDVLGFRPYWEGGMRDDRPTWISLQLPDGRDWVEYMIVGTPGIQGIPRDMSAADLGVLNHFALGIPDARAAYTLLWNGDRLAGQDQTPKIGRDAKWQLNLLDPDGTRAELMEFHAIGKPCYSPFRAPDPER
ncbi:VOC family protein [Sphingomonas arantia]|uniref:VOC family protein n=1 Tax=Sphingomonas arantia TaxID=1460676 RepID=A0ABW4TZ27_9SPHN